MSVVSDAKNMLLSERSGTSSSARTDMLRVFKRRLKESIRVAIAFGLYYSGLIRLAHWWTRRTAGQRLIILTYHQATGENLRRQLLYLHRHYRVLHLEDALSELYAPHKVRDTQDRRIPLALTFDDGYLDNYTYAWRLAREFQIPFTIFVVPGYSESGNCFWWLSADYLVKHTKVDHAMVAGQTYNLSQPSERQVLAKVIDTHVRYAQSVAEREAFLADVQQALNVSLPSRLLAGEADTSLPINWTEIRAMEQSGWVSFGAHTMHHPILDYLSDPAEIQYEVEESRRVLEQQLGHPVRLFSYPVGRYKKALQAVRSTGYDWAVTTIDEINTPQVDPHLLRRIPGDERVHWLVMAAELVGLLGIMSRLRKKR